MQWKKIAAAAVAAAMAVSLAACSGVNIDSLTLDAPQSMEAGETVQLSVDYGSTADGVTEEAIAEAAQKVELTWTSSDEAVATVDDAGVVTAVAAGEAEITAAIPDTEVSVSCTVTVTPAIEGVEAPESLELAIGGEDSKSLDAKLVPDGAVGAELTYESSDEAVAAVDENGTVTAVGNGECVITITATKMVEISDEETAETAESGSDSTPAEASESTAADAEAEDAPMMEANVQTWTAQTAVTVTTAAEGITLSRTSGSLYVGNSANVSVYTTPEAASAAVASEVTYTSSDESVATVVGTTEGAAGFTLTGKGAGTATITAEYRGMTAEYTVTVSKYVAPARTNTSGGSGAAAGGGTATTTPTPAPSQPSGGGTTTAPAPDPTPAPQPDPVPETPVTPPEGGAIGGGNDGPIPGGGSDENNGGDAEIVE